MTGGKPIASGDVEWEEWSDVPRFAIRYRPLTLAACGPDYQVGVAIEELRPGMQSSPAHYHIHEEEHVYVLEGTVTVRIGADSYGADDYHVGVRIESPEPGKRLCPMHYHLLEEEQALVLEGQVRLLLGDQQYEMTAGDYICFPAGQQVAHSFMNSGDGPCAYLMIGSHNPNDVCVYPDSNKVAVKALHSHGTGILDLSGVRGYWDGE